MRIVALEEHFDIPRLVGQISPELIRQRGFPPMGHMANATAVPQEN